MIRNNLSLLLAERGLKATKVSFDTGIARSTLSKIVNNASEKIDYSTINSLCNYLKITPCDFFEYSPIEVDFYVDVDDESGTRFQKIWRFSAFIRFKEYGEKETASIEYEGSVVDMGLPFIQDGEPLSSRKVSLGPALGESTKPLEAFSITFQTKISNDFNNFISEEVKAKLGEEKPYIFNINIFG